MPCGWNNVYCFFWHYEHVLICAIGDMLLFYDNCINTLSMQLLKNLFPPENSVFHLRARVLVVTSPLEKSCQWKKPIYYLLSGVWRQVHTGHDQESTSTSCMLKRKNKLRRCVEGTPSSSGISIICCPSTKVYLKLQGARPKQAGADCLSHFPRSLRRTRKITKVWLMPLNMVFLAERKISKVFS